MTTTINNLMITLMTLTLGKVKKMTHLPPSPNSRFTEAGPWGFPLTGRMRKSGLIAALAVAGLLTGGAAVVQADDLEPPSWRLTPPYATLQEWTFDTDPMGLPFVVADNITMSGDGVHPNSGSDPVAAFANMTWTPTPDGTGAWQTSSSPGLVELWIPNWIDTEPLKKIRVQFTYENLSGDLFPLPFVQHIEGFDSDSGTSVNGTFVDRGGPIPALFSNQFHVYEDWEMEPNPDWETIFIEVPEQMLLHQIVVDTISIPEPASLALLGLGGLLMLRRQRRRQPGQSG